MLENEIKIDKEEEEYEDNPEMKSIIELIEKEIESRGLELQDFTDFCKNEMQNDNLELINLSTDEVENLVQKFVVISSKCNTIKGDDDSLMSNRSLKLNISTENEISDNNQLIEEQGLKTKIIPSTELANLTKANILITNYEIISHSLFSQPDIEFTIEIDVYHSLVKRSYYDFIWLQNELTKMFPNTIIPILFKLPYFKTITDKYIQKKVRYLNRFLLTLYQNELIKNTKIFENFLLYSTKEFQAYKKGINNTNVSLISDIYTKNGIFKTDYDNSNNIKNIIQNIGKQGIYLSVLNKSLKDVLIEFNILKDKLKILSNAFFDLGKTFNDSAKTQLFKYSRITNNWSKYFDKQHLLINLNLKEFISFSYKMNIKLQQAIKDYEYAYQYKDSHSNKENRIHLNYGFNLNRLNELYNYFEKEYFEKNLRQLNKILQSEKYSFFNGIGVKKGDMILKTPR